ncbi:MAG: Vps53-like protein [Lentinula lateritia]|uniref:Vps53-like protein n=1 Tax=Lentinula lateritia TaxID=40482 RepID=A0ABQ8VVQ3_9AGAR|nr:MAG: Vps53-like protein [Lentinula lateritia]KAJ4500443.1 Vps53-like protein [Lentinula lateritia]
MQNDDLPTEVLIAVQRVFENHSSPAAGASSNAIDALNSLFPNESSLAYTEAVQARLLERQREIQKEIDLLREQLKRNQDSDRMQLIQEMISELLGQMSRIREKATESEAVVRSITKDIQVLDLAKKNLILSMTTLKRLQMLVNALAQLEDLLSERKYREISQTLAAVKQLASTFTSYMSVPRVLQTWKQIQELQIKLRSVIDKDFDTFYLQDSSKGMKPAVIADACLVVDVLGEDFRSLLVERYVALELKEYRRIFRTSDEAGQLDNISRRFSWFRRLLQTHELEQGRVFPSEWKVGWHLLAKFTEITRDDITTLLSTAGKSLTVKTLLDNLQIAAEFESSMAKKWATPYQDMLSATVQSNSRPPKPLTHAFDPHMSVFVDAQDRALSDMLAPHRKNKGLKSTPRHSLETLDAEDGDENSSSPIVVLPSSTELFYFYAQSLEQCAKLSRGSPLFELCNVHKKWLRIYAEDVLRASLKQRLPPIAAPRKSIDSARFDIAELKQASMVINTADYCQTTASELEDKIRSNIDEEFKEKVSLQEERDLFVSAISAAIVVQLRELESACEPAFSSMSRSVWSNLNHVSGPSAYTAELVRTAEQIVEALKPTVEQKKYLRNFLDKACSLIIAKFTNSLVKSRPLKEIGAEQLLIDLQTVKAYLSKMPGDSLITPSYTRSLSKSTTRLESLLKVIVTPVDPPEGFILNYTLLIGDASFSNFQKILDLKGTPKGEQNHLLDSFVTITSTKDELQGTSFLSSLDMDPPSVTQLGGTLTSPAIVSATESIFSGLVSPPISGPPTGSTEVSRNDQRREVFSDFKRFVSFGLRRDSSQIPP